MASYTRGKLLGLLSREFTDGDVAVLTEHPEIREKVLRLVRAPHEVSIPAHRGYEIMGGKCVHLEACEEVFPPQEAQDKVHVRLFLPSTAPEHFERVPYSAEQLEQYRETHTLMPMFPVTINALLRLFAEEVFRFIGERGYMIGDGPRSWFHYSDRKVKESALFREEVPQFGWRLVRTSYPAFSLHSECPRRYRKQPEAIPFGSPERLMRPCEFALMFVLHSKLGLMKWKDELPQHSGQLTCSGDGHDLPFTSAEIYDNRYSGPGCRDTLGFAASHGEYPATLVKPLPLCG